MNIIQKRSLVIPCGVAVRIAAHPPVIAKIVNDKGSTSDILSGIKELNDVVREGDHNGPRRICGQITQITHMPIL